MGSVRTEVTHANAALVLALVTIGAATVGGRWAGGATALAGAVGFDFFLTEPYGSLAIKDGSEIVTTILLFVLGVAVGQIVGERARAERGKQAGADEVSGLHRVAQLVSGDAPLSQVITTVEDEIAKVLLVPEATYTLLPPDPAPPVMDGSGRVDAPYVHLEDGFALPSPGVLVPVRGAGTARGWVVCGPPSGLVGVSSDRRRTALVLAGLLGAALAHADVAPA